MDISNKIIITPHDFAYKLRRVRTGKTDTLTISFLSKDGGLIEDSHQIPSIYGRLAEMYLEHKFNKMVLT